MIDVNINLIHVFCSKQYAQEVTDDNQPLLVSHIKKMGPGGRLPSGPAMLVPELCYLTGYLLVLQHVTLNSD